MTYMLSTANKKLMKTSKKTSVILIGKEFKKKKKKGVSWQKGVADEEKGGQLPMKDQSVRELEMEERGTNCGVPQGDVEIGEWV